ncbi:MAG: PilT/PilU family type 4a pilus ATPase [Myxococcales bacterium]|nr:PilT/PilU family type 4a pilus ATPase [Myxococcales bacterium]MBK7191504.1 PilT/PilU family type 4a pilus ATPase [Myxococcales bacterium]
MAFVDELVPPATRAALDAKGSADVQHAVGADGYAIAIERTTAGFRLLVRQARPALAAVAPPAAPSAPPPAPGRATASPAVATPPPPARDAASPPSAHAAAAAARPAASVAALLAAVAHAAARQASDLLLSSGLVPRVRIDGDLVELDDAAPSADDLRALVAHLGGDAAAHELARDGAVDFGATVGAARLRGHGFAHERGVGVAIRLLRTDVPSLTSLGLPEDLTALVTQRSGLVLVAGPTGSGKSTTLVALVGYLNHHRARHVVTLEDPIEFLHEPDRCLIHQREIGRHAPSFASGLRAALREAPDVIVVGELRDAETIGIALTAAETGHLVLGTVHAPGAGGAIDRLIDAYPAHQQDQARTQVAAALRCVLTQYLLPTRHGGRAVALERVPITPAIAALIRKDELQMLQTHLQTGRDAGMVPLERNLARLVRAGLVDGAVARAAAIDLDYFERAVRG